jgi:hypothetical protein
VGTADYSYSRPGVGQPVSITAHFRQVKDDNSPGNKNDADYAFSQQPGGPGSMDFALTTPTTATQVGGRGVVRSRWQFSGAGRSDVQITPADGTTFALSECWDQNYASVYKQGGGDSWGLESSCVFPTAEYLTLP